MITRDYPNITKLRQFIDCDNIAELLPEDQLNIIAQDVVREAEEDDATRSEWFDKYNKALDIAKQIVDEKTYPFPKAANIKLPIIGMACIQFNARLYPELIQDNKTVYVSVMGDKPSTDQEDAAQRISDYMSVQTLRIVENWRADTDKLLMCLPLVGTIFRKWIYDPIERKPKAFLCLPTEIIVNNNVTTLEDAPRVTHVLRLSKNEIIENIRAEFYVDISECMLDDEYSATDTMEIDSEKTLPSNIQDDGDYHVLFEQIRWIDLDEDGYKEPYIVTVHRTKKKLLRIQANYTEDNFVYYKNKLVKIMAEQIYTAHIFLPSFDGTFLGLGFGHLLTHLNTVANTITNNLIDAATLSNLHPAFIDNEFRVPKGEMAFTPGELKKVDVPMGKSLMDGIVPLPISEPSPVLFQLLQMLVDFSKQVANISDVLMGQTPGANTPATTVVTMVEQGTKVYSSILTRLYESFRKEYEILFAINRKCFSEYADKKKSATRLQKIGRYLRNKIGVNSDEPSVITMSDFERDDLDILPIANPAMGTDAVRLAKIHALMQVMQNPMINQHEVLKRYLEALKITEINKILVPEEQLQQPSPQDMLVQAELAQKQAQVELTNVQKANILMQNEIELLRLELDEKRMQVDAAYKGGQLAGQKVTAMSTLAQAEATAGSANVATAERITDQQQVKSTPQVSTAEIDQVVDMMQNNLQSAMGGGNVSQNPNQSAVGQPAQSAQEGQQVNLPPDLHQELQSIADQQQQEQQTEQAPQGITQ